MVKHLGLVLANNNNQKIVARMRKCVQKRIMEKEKLMKIRGKLNVGVEVVEKKEFRPKFSYVESKMNE